MAMGRSPVSTDPMNERQPPPKRGRHAHRAGDIQTWHDVFDDGPRRRILSHLSEESQPVSLGALVDLFEAVPDDASESVPGSDGRRAVRTWLLAEHVVPLESFGVIEYDRAAETIRVADDVSVVATTDDD